jgi:2-keto-4-pentenoate hydratase
MGSPRAGWKVAASSPNGRQAIGVDRPLAGAIYADQLVADRAVLAPTHLAMVEAEIVFRMATSFEPERSPFERDAVVAGLEAVYAGLEIPDCRLEAYPKVSAPQLVADFMCGQYLAVGPALPVDLSALAAIAVVVARNDVVASRGTGADVLGDPCSALTWLVNEVTARGETVRAGDVMSTGACAWARDVRAGDTVVATFGELATVSVGFEATTAN